MRLLPNLSQRMKAHFPQTHGAAATAWRRTASAVSAALACCMLMPARATAQSDDEVRVSERVSIEGARGGLFLPNTIAPSLGRQAAGAVGLGGYDTAQRSPVTSMLGELHVYGPLDLRLGLNYTPNVAEGASPIEPQFGGRLHLLAQAEQGIDAAAVLNYRLDRYTKDSGLMQAMFVVGRRFGRIGLLANLGYGQDPEGDDREGEAALAAMYSFSEPLQIGFESHARFDLFSSDPRRAARHDALAQIASGPTLHYGIGSLIVLAQVGVSTLVGTESTRAGAIGLAGVGGVY
jgi:hypothetical protein